MEHDRVPETLDRLTADEARTLTPPVQAGLALPIASLIFPPTGIIALQLALRARRWEGDRKQMLRLVARSRLWAWYSFGIALTLVILAFLISIFVLNNFAVTDEYLSPQYLAISMPIVVKAFFSNLAVSVVAECTSLVWGMALAIARGLPGKAAAPLRMLAIAYIDVFRGLPALLTILIIGFGLPQTGLPIVSTLDLFQSGTLALTIVYGAYVAEVFRAGIESIHWGQTSAARSLGLTYVQTMRFVVVPQAVRRVIPPLLSWYISLLKDTSLLSVLGLLEGVNMARILVTGQSNLSALTGVSLCFLVVTIPLARFTDYLLRRSAAKLKAAS